jgi:fatty-acyl-CoA synthase
MTGNPAYLSGLDRNKANYTPLNPVTFLERAAYVYPDQTSVVYGGWRMTWRETYARCRRLASALARRGIGRNDTVAVMAPNVPAIYEAHFGVPMIGAVINTLNTRLDADTIAFMLRHGGARVLITDTEFSATIEAALAKLDEKPLVIDIEDPATAADGVCLGEMTYEAFLETGDPQHAWINPADEWDAIALNYTSGTTGDPKGVVYHYRGAYLNAVSNILDWNMPQFPVYLWTLPMFHCNGWCFPWTIAERAGTNVCLRRVEAKAMWDAIHTDGVTHLCGAPIVYLTLINAPPDLRGPMRKLAGQIAGAAPPPAIIEGAEKVGIELTHVYGLTETYGPAAVCPKHPAWVALPIDQRAERNGRQGVRVPMQEGMAVFDPETMNPAPWNGETMGEIMFRGNITMKGYLRNPTATKTAFAGGWFHSGDLAVTQPDGYIKIRDRSKDIIISGGENISSLEVEETLYRHPAVLSAAVVAQPDEKWGETPCAFIELMPQVSVTGDELRAFCRENMAHYKVPKTFIFRELPKTSTGKIQKFVLRQLARSTDALR